MEALQREFNSEKQKSIALQSSYDDEKLLRLKTEDSLQQLRKIHETLACNCEMSEEFIVNKLICKIEKAKLEKEKLAIDLEREEEGLTNKLQRQLTILRCEKDQMDQEVEDLKKQVEKMRCEQEQMARKVEAEQELLSNNLFKKLHKALQEKCDLENQLSRSNSTRNTMCGSTNGSITGISDTPNGKDRSNSDLSIVLPVRKLSDASDVAPRKRPPLSPETIMTLQSCIGENSYI